MSYLLKYKRFGKNSILIEWPNTIDEMILQSIIEYKVFFINLRLLKYVIIIEIFGFFFIFVYKKSNHFFFCISK